jgi:hypothetical protein
MDQGCPVKYFLDDSAQLPDVFTGKVIGALTMMLSYCTSTAPSQALGHLA